MLAYLKGQVVRRGSNFVVVDTGGVGYKVYIPAPLLGKKELTLFCFHQVREDASDLYGFETAEELEIFEMLLSVSGVGPKAALTLVSALGKNKIISAISSSDTTAFKSIPGIGNKVAAKIIVELKSKVMSGDTGSLLPEDDETVEALVGLGYRKQEILPHLRAIPQDLVSVQDKVKFLLREIGKK